MRGTASGQEFNSTQQQTLGVKFWLRALRDMDTLTKSCSPTIVITANGEVQTHEEAIVYVKELDIFLTMKVLDNTPAVLSLGKLCDENGYSYEWINGQTTSH